MKVCFINLLFSKEGQAGGLGSHIARLSSALTKLGHEVTVATSGAGREYYRSGVRIVPLGVVDAYSSRRQLLNPSYLFRRLIYMLRLTRFVLAEKFNVAEVADGGLEQLLLAIYRNCALVTKLHGNFRFAFSHGTLLTRLVERLEAWTVRRSDLIYSSTLQYAEWVSRAYQIPVERFKIIPCGIELGGIRSFQPQDLTQRYPRIKGKRLVLLSVGMSPQRKGADIFIEAARKLAQRSDLLFVLSCEDQKFLAVTQMPGNVLQLSNLSQHEFYNWLIASKIVVYPSTTESFSIAMHEAMFFRKTIVISPTIPFEGIDREYPRRVTLTSLDAHSLADTVSEIADQRRQFPEVSDELYRALEEYYDIEHVARDTEKLYLQACAAAGTAQRPASMLR
jgi:glycosyltransferase involved in cell wall biosynthesis